MWRLLKQFVCVLAVAGLFLGMPGKMLMADATSPALQAQPIAERCASCKGLPGGGHADPMMGSACVMSGGCATFVDDAAGSAWLLEFGPDAQPVVRLDDSMGRMRPGPDPRPPKRQLLA